MNEAMRTLRVLVLDFVMQLHGSLQVRQQAYLCLTQNIGQFEKGKVKA